MRIMNYIHPESYLIFQIIRFLRNQIIMQFEKNREGISFG
jgi:hypothetical protein